MALRGYLGNTFVCVCVRVKVKLQRQLKRAIVLLDYGVETLFQEIHTL